MIQQLDGPTLTRKQIGHIETLLGELDRFPVDQRTINLGGVLSYTAYRHASDDTLFTVSLWAKKNGSWTSTEVVLNNII